MADTSGLTLQEPTQVDWDNLNAGGKYQAPPAAIGADGKSIVYNGQLPTTITAEQDDEGFRNYLLDPIKLVKNGQGIDGYELRFARVGLKPWKNGKNGTALLLKGAGVTAKPQLTKEYDAAMQLIKGRVVPLTIDWEARNKETGESVRGYANFPDNPAFPGTKKSILKMGDTYTDKDGQVQTVKSEVLFANARLRFFEVGKK